MIKYIAIVVLGLLVIAGVAFGMLPEWVNWALMILGFAMIGTMILHQPDDEGPRVRFP
jgi:hypothetical protein